MAIWRRTSSPRFAAAWAIRATSSGARWRRSSEESVITLQDGASVCDPAPPSGEVDAAAPYVRRARGSRRTHAHATRTVRSGISAVSGNACRGQEKLERGPAGASVRDGDLRPWRAPRPFP